MNGPRRGRFERIAYSPGWQNPLPPALRLIAELHFGTLIFVAIAAGVKEGLGAGAFMLFVASLAFFITRIRCADSPAAWWISVVMFTAMGVLLCVITLTV